jgi:hypothetical protein
MQVLLNDFTSPSTPAFAVAILAWNGIPNFTATVLNNRIDGLVPFLRLVDIFESFYSSNYVNFKIISKIVNT